MITVTPTASTTSTRTTTTGNRSAEDPRPHPFRTALEQSRARVHVVPLEFGRLGGSGNALASCQRATSSDAQDPLVPHASGRQDQFGEARPLRAPRAAHRRARPSPSSVRSATTARSSPAARASIPILNMRLASPGPPRRHQPGRRALGHRRRGRLACGSVRWSATRALERSEEAYAALPLLRQALLNVAHPAIRNRGTTVGSIAHADAAGEMPAILALTDGVVEVVGPAGAREIVAGLLPRRARDVLGPEELAVAVRFGRFARGHGHRVPRVGAAVTVTTRWPAVGVAVTLTDGTGLRRPRLLRVGHGHPVGPRSRPAPPRSRAGLGRVG